MKKRLLALALTGAMALSLLGACGNRADYTLRFARTGARSSLNLCTGCLTEIWALADRLTGADDEAQP